MTNEQNGPGLTVSPGEREQWVRRYRESGQGLKHFSKEHGLRYTQLHYWIYGSRQSRHRGRASKEEANPAFQEFILAPSSKNDWAAEIALSHGMSLRVSGSADPAWVGALLDQVRRSCSH